MMGKAKSDVLQGTLDLLILRTLVRGPQHGYGIAVHIQLASDEVLLGGNTLIVHAVLG